MVSVWRRYRWSFLGSLFAHAAVLLFFYHSFFFRHSFVGNKSEVIEQVYLFTAPKNHSLSITIAKAALRKPAPQKSTIIKKDRSVTIEKNTTATMIAHDSEQHFNALTAGKKEVLLAALHDAVARQLVYPQAALSLDLGGAITLRFLLLPSGTILQITVKHSSGSAILDHAASRTLNSVSPFLLAKDYLKTPEYFTIPVVFKSD